jgi:TonB-dependent receptor
VCLPGRRRARDFVARPGSLRERSDHRLEGRPPPSGPAEFVNHDRFGSFFRGTAAGLPLVVNLLLVAVLSGAPAWAQSESEEPTHAGTIVGRVEESESGAPLQGVRVIVTWPAPTDGSEPHEELAITDAGGSFHFDGIPEGTYAVEFVKAGYRDDVVKGVSVRSGEERLVDRALSPLAPGESDQPPPGVEEIMVTGARAEAIEASRAESNEMLNTLNAAEISKFAASDVADVILRIPGVNVVQGQFAVIRGLEDRYSSTLFNSAVVPSPDPNRQSIQLDLFPNEVVEDLVVSKTFGPELPSNSSAGSINILTTGYPDDFEAELKAKGGFNTKAVKKFLEYDNNSPVGREIDGWDTLASEYGGGVGQRTQLFGREFRFKMIGDWGEQYQTANGFQEGREPRNRSVVPPGQGDLSFGNLGLTAGRFDLTTSDYSKQVLGYGGFGFDFDEAGNHKWDVSIFYTKKEEQVVELKENGYYANYNYGTPDQFGTAVQKATDGEGIFPSFFDGSVTATGNGTNRSWLTSQLGNRMESDVFGSQAANGALFFSNFNESRSFKTDRDLLVTQLNGDHTFESIEGLHFKYAANYATTSQNEQAFGMRYFYEPCGFDLSGIPCPAGVTRIDIPTVYPAKVGDLGPGRWYARNGAFTDDNDIQESQYFSRADGDYEIPVPEGSESSWLQGVAVKLNAGGWYEYATRDVDSNFLPPEKVQANGAACPLPTCDVLSPSNFAVFGGDPGQVAHNLFGTALTRDRYGDFAGHVDTTSHGKREIQAGYTGAKATFFDDFDLLGGVRIENIYIESKNDPFQPGQFHPDVTPLIYPTKYFFFDREDNPARNELGVPGPYNDQLLGIKVQTAPCRDLSGNLVGGDCVDLVNRQQIKDALHGEIDETKYLPAVGITYRPIEGLALRAAYSQTVARPSFREMGYYPSVEPGTDDQIVGNPQLQLSDVDSYDLRAEYVWGDFGDLVAVSGFYKTIDKPIEQILVRDVGNFTSDAIWRTFFNNPNQATLWGIEFEARKNLGFVAPLVRAPSYEGIAEYFTVGGNFTWIDAEVDRSDLEIQRAENFFGTAPGVSAPYSQLHPTRRLYGQPKWMVNADVTFDQPDWGTKATLALYAISDVLDAAGTAVVGRDNRTVQSLTLDRYVDSFYKLDFVMSQDIWNGVALKFTARNLTDSKREIVYDPSQTHGTIAERSYKVGRSFSLEARYTFSKLPWE